MEVEVSDGHVVLPDGATLIAVAHRHGKADSPAESRHPHWLGPVARCAGNDPSRMTATISRSSAATRRTWRWPPMRSSKPVAAWRSPPAAKSMHCCRCRSPVWFRICRLRGSRRRLRGSSRSSGPHRRLEPALSRVQGRGRGDARMQCRSAPDRCRHLRCRYGQGADKPRFSRRNS